MIVRECIYYVNLRQAYLSSPYYSQRISSRTILLTCVPKQYLDEHRLRKLYGDSVKRVCIPRTTKALANLVKEREQTAMRLEKAEVELIQKANKAKDKQLKKASKKVSKKAAKESKIESKPQPPTTATGSVASQQDLVFESNGSSDNGIATRGGCPVIELPADPDLEPFEKREFDGDHDETVKYNQVDETINEEDDEYTHPYGLDPDLPDVRGSVAAQWIPVQARPYHRPLGNFGRRVDTIRWTRNRLRELNAQIFKMRRQVRRGDGNTLPAAFIEFDTQESAQAAQQVLAHHRPLQMSSRILGIRPDEILWATLRMPWWERIARRFFILSLVTAAVIFWSIPSAVIGLVSNIDFLAEKIVVLFWIKKLPTVIVNFLQGFVPAIALSLWMAAIPFMLRCTSTLLATCRS